MPSHGRLQILRRSGLSITEDYSFIFSAPRLCHRVPWGTPYFGRLAIGSPAPSAFCNLQGLSEGEGGKQAAVGKVCYAALALPRDSRLGHVLGTRPHIPYLPYPHVP